MQSLVWHTMIKQQLNNSHQMNNNNSRTQAYNHLESKSKFNDTGKPFIHVQFLPEKSKLTVRAVDVT